MKKKRPLKKKPLPQATHVLIVEDSAIQATMLARILKTAGYRTDWAKDGVQALAFLAEKRPDIVVSDVRMPHMDGIELCSSIRQDKKLDGIPVILLTALADAEDVIRGLTAGADNYVTKPYEAGQMLGKIENELHADKSVVHADAGRIVRVNFGDRQYRVDVPPVQIIKLLLSTYENIISQNKLLIDSQVALKSLNRHLEAKVIEIKATSEQLRSSEERFRTIVQLVPDLVYRIDELGKFVFLNDAVKVLGYEPHELMGKHFSILIDKKDLQGISREALLSAYAGKATGDALAPKMFDERRTGSRATTGLEVHLRMKGGKLKRRGQVLKMIGEVSSAGFYHESDSGSSVFCGTVGAIRDITERKHMENKLQSLNLQLEDKVLARTRELCITNTSLKETLTELKRTQESIILSEKLAAFGTLVAGVAHDLNNPLMGGINYIQYVRKHTDSHKLRDYLDKAEHEVERASRIVLNMLSYSRKPPAKCSMVSITEVIEAVRELIDANLRQLEVEFVVSMPKGLPGVWAKFDSLQQVFLNLISNAIDAVKDMPARKIHIKARTINDFVQVEVQDTGKGISKIDQRRIFDPFFTTKEVGDGTGLGLTASKNIVSGFGGSIRCDSKKGAGATFFISLPTSSLSDLGNS